MTNTTTGSLTVSFKLVEDRINFRLEHFNDHVYHKRQIEVILKVSSNTNKTECYREGNEFAELMRRRLLLIKCDNLNFNCDEASDTIDVDFKNLHTACYQVEIRHDKQEDLPFSENYEYKPFYSCPAFFATGHPYPIDVSRFHKPEVACQILNKSTLHVSTWPLISNGSKDPDQYFSVLVDENDETNRIYPNKSHFRVLENGMMSYQYDSLKPGIYCHGIRYMDGRCLLSDTCDALHGCVWTHKIVVVESQPSNRSDNSDTILLDNSPIVSYWLIKMSIFISIVAVLLVLLSCAVRKIRRFQYPKGYWYRKIESEELLIMLNDRKSSVIPLTTRKKILLLYPRDCRLIMQAMIKLRSILHLNGCEVVDVWDPKLAETIRSDPIRFLHKNIEDEARTPIILASHCSKLLYDKYSETIVVDYKEPEEFDNLFLYGLKCIRENIEKKYFVVRLADPSFLDMPCEESLDIGLPLSELNMLENYKLPLQLEVLILNIHGAEVVDFEKVKLNGTKEHMELKKLINEFSEYRLQNPNYLLDEFITVTPRDYLL
ncbi:uncharacterized protein LOC120351372 isoform X2 [Nilaparvata lugens]|nr:uncharacterized protein LOC120351372 isoform X2 [Nilaparvata lugens]